MEKCNLKSENAVETKVCSKCGIGKPVLDFYTAPNTDNGLRKRCKECMKSHMRQYYTLNRTEFLSKNKKYYDDNSEKCKIAAKRWHDANKESYSAYKKTYKKKRCNTEPLFKLREALGVRIRQSLSNRGFTKKSRTREMVGLDFEYLRNYLEYTWFLNYGTEYDGQPVHIDHIVPCSAANTEQEIIALQHWSNLQYLTPEDNLAKSDRG